MADLFETLGLGPKPPDDNIVFYAIYPDQQPAGDAELVALREACMQALQPLLSHGYIWQAESFNLTPSCHVAPPWAEQRRPQRRGRRVAAGQPSAESAAPATAANGDAAQPGCVWGCVRWGDNVEDEWWIVHLLRTLTAQMPDTSAQVWDNDGEFLLIEAAYALPKWLKPDTARHRVWLRGGAMHIIPQPSPKAPALPAFPTLMQALQILSSGTVSTRSQRAEDAIAARLAGQPAAGLAAGRHMSRVLLPVRLAAVLRRDPQLVAAAVEAFFYRDADDMKAAARMAQFPASEARVPVVVATNRCHYAQLAQQRFEPPRGFRLPPPGHPMAAPAERGLKLTAGFEILAARAQRMGLQVAPEHGSITSTPPVSLPASDASQRQRQEQQQLHTSMSEQDVARHPMWPAFKASLQGAGYFQGELPGSARYKELLGVAVKDFASSAQASAHAGVALPAQRLVQLLAVPQVAGATEQEFCSDAGVAEDDDSWMEGMGARLEQELGRREQEKEEVEAQQQGQRDTQAAGAPPAGGGGVGKARPMHVDAGDVASAVKDFMSYAMSGLEGAEVPSDLEGVAFDPSLFFQQLERVLGGIAGDEETSTGTASTKRGPGAGHAAMGGVGHDDEDDEWDTTDGEGSSFFSDEDEEDETDSEGGYASEGEGVAHDGMAGAGGPGRAGPHLLDTTPNFKSAKPPLSAPARSTTPAAQPPVPVTAQSSAATLSASTDQQPASAQVAVGMSVDAPHAAQPPVRHSLASLQEHWEVCTATDSDDEDDEGEEEEEGDSDDDDSGEEEQRQGAGRAWQPVQSSAQKKRRFQSAYDQVLCEQLAGTTMEATVERAAGPRPDGNKGPEGTAQGHAQQQSGSEPQQAGAVPLQPLDLDFNLVRNLLKSVSEQQGMAGPATNLAGLLGLQLPHGGDLLSLD